jgi:hypothetical protein
MLKEWVILATIDMRNFDGNVAEIGILSPGITNSDPGIEFQRNLTRIGITHYTYRK